MKSSSIRSAVLAGIVALAGLLSMQCALFKPDVPGAWARSYGGVGGGYTVSSAACVSQTLDGGFIVAGSRQVDVGGLGQSDMWVLKLDTDGEITWQRALGGELRDASTFIAPANAGGYLLVGRTELAGFENREVYQIALVRFDQHGTPFMQRACGSDGESFFAHSLSPCSDGGYIMAAEKGEGGVWGGPDPVVLKLTPDLTIEWQKTFSAGFYEIHTLAACQTTDGEYVVVGYARRSGDTRDLWVARLGSDGTPSWQKLFGGDAEDEEGTRTLATPSGGVLVAGYTGSYGADNRDLWLMELNAEGAVVVQGIIGGSSDDYATCISAIDGGGYIVGGLSESIVGGLTDGDFWLMRLDSDLAVEWQWAYGGPVWDEPFSVAQTVEGEIIVAGSTGSFTDSGTAAWVLNLPADGALPDASFVREPTVASVTTAAVGKDSTFTVTDATSVTSDLALSRVDTEADVQTQYP